MSFARLIAPIVTTHLDLDLDNSRQEPEAITATRKSSPPPSYSSVIKSRMLYQLNGVVVRNGP